jgi:hypothetical protein
MSLLKSSFVVALLAIASCKPVDGVVYTDPSRPEAQEWSQGPSAVGSPAAALRREHDQLRGMSGASACSKGHGLRSALAELENAPAPQEDPAWDGKVARVRSAVSDVERAIGDECAGNGAAVLSAALGELDRALAAVDG